MLENQYSRPRALLFEEGCKDVDQSIYVARVSLWRELIAKDFDLTSVYDEVELEHSILNQRPDVLFLIVPVGSPRLVEILQQNNILRAGLFICRNIESKCWQELQSLERLKCDAYFSFENLPANGNTEIAERAFIMPRWLDDSAFWDYGHSRTIPVGLYGDGFVDETFLYPWRRKVGAQLLGSLPCLTASEPYPFFLAVEPGKEYAELLSRTRIALTCGSIGRSLSLDHLAICASRAALFCEETPLLKSLGFRDGENCVFVTAENALEGVSEYLSYEPGLTALAERGYRFVRERHVLSQRNQLILWFRLWIGPKLGQQRITQPDAVGPLVLAPHEPSSVDLSWCERNPLEQTLDEAYAQLWSFRFKEALPRFQSIVEGIPHHVVACVGEVLCRLGLGEVDAVASRLASMTASFRECSASAEPDRVLDVLGLLVGAISMDGVEDDSNEMVRLDDDGSLYIFLNQLLAKHADVVAQERGRGVAQSDVLSADSIHYRLNATESKWLELLELFFDAAGQGGKWSKLLGESIDSQRKVAAEMHQESEEELRELLNAARTAGEAWGVSQMASERNELTLAFEASRDAVSLNRDFALGYEFMGLQLMQVGNYEEGVLCLREAYRLKGHEISDAAVLEKLGVDPRLRTEAIDVYEGRVFGLSREPSEMPRKILVLTNRPLPEELGGDEQALPDLCRELMARGHEVKILTTQTDYVSPLNDGDFDVVREMRVFGHWSRSGDPVFESDDSIVTDVARHNLQVSLGMVGSFKPDVCLAWNLDFLSGVMLNPILEAGIPIVHRMESGLSGYQPEATPTSSLFCIAGASRWLNDELRKVGYGAHSFALLPPSVFMPRFYRLLPPKLDILKICYCGPMVLSRGPHVLLEALVFLKDSDVAFSCSFAGAFADPEYEKQFRLRLDEADLGEDVVLLPTANAAERSQLFAKSNVLVIPSLAGDSSDRIQIEAQAAGLTVVRTSEGAHDEFAVSEVNALLAKASDPADLARQFSFLFANPESWRRIGEQGQVDAFRFSTRNTVRILEEIFEELLGRAEVLGEKSDS